MGTWTVVLGVVAVGVLIVMLAMVTGSLFAIRSRLEDLIALLFKIHMDKGR